MFEVDQAAAAAPPQKLRMKLSKIILNFTPSWFSVNMGTGIISILLSTAPYQFTGLKYIAIVFYVLNCILFLTFLTITIARYIMFPSVFTKMLYHPAQSMFTGTFPMAIATIANATVLLVVPTHGRWAINLAWSLWWVEVFFTVLTCFGVPFVMFRVHELQLDKMTATWLLPIVPAVVTAASGGLLSTVLEPTHGLITLIFSYCLWGMGMGLSFLVIALYLHRLTIYKIPGSEVVVSAFLPLGPLGQGTFGLIEMAVAGKKIFAETAFLESDASDNTILKVSVIFGFMMWGLGLWWLVHGITSVLSRYLKGNIPFNMGFWGFVFPLGVFTSATIILGKVTHVHFFSYLSMVFIGLLVLLWLLIAYGTLKRAINRSIFVAPCLSVQ